jgi:hypothetical protein
MPASTKDATKQQRERRSKAAQAEGTHSSKLPSSHGDSPKEVIPKDITPDHASWNDRQTRDIASADTVQREEALLDEAIEQTFPASDPIAELPASPESEKTAQCKDEDEALLDEAIEETFPASDPIAFTPHEKLVVLPKI